MFTGIIAHRGTVVKVDEHDGVRRIGVDAGPLADLSVGDSISLNGVCLTAVAVGDGVVDVEVVAETLARTNLGSIETRHQVNLERPMPADGRFDGHLVQGHVDGTGKVLSVSGGRGETRVMVEVPQDLERYVVEKGSVTIDGVSLTVASLGSGWLEVALIPHTLEATNLGLRQVGDQVNLEVDILAKYVEKLLRAPG